MSKEDLLIIGAGGHARSILDISIENNEYNIIGCIDATYPYRTNVDFMEDIKIVGNDSCLQQLYQDGVKNIFVAIGENKLRNMLYDQVVQIGFTPVNIISKHARISERAILGKGICIMAGAVVNVNCNIEDNCIINTNCSIDHDCNIGKSVHIAPGCAISGYVKIGEQSHLGTGCIVIDRVSIGKKTYIGAGSVVVKSIENGVLAYGVPAKKIKKIEKE